MASITFILSDSQLRYHTVCGETDEGGPEGLAIGNKPCNGIGGVGIALGIMREIM